MAKILSIIAPNNYQDKEYGDSKTALEAAGHTVITASTANEAHGVLGGSVKTDLLLLGANSADYDAILFVGGGGCFDLFDNANAHKLAKDFLNAGKVVSAICAAPSILGNAGILDGVRATCFPSQTNHIIEKGANFTGQHVEKDGLIITADGPGSATEFGEAVAEALR